MTAPRSKLVRKTCLFTIYQKSLPSTVLNRIYVWMIICFPLNKNIKSIHLLILATVVCISTEYEHIVQKTTSSLVLFLYVISILSFCHFLFSLKNSSNNKKTTIHGKT